MNPAQMKTGISTACFFPQETIQAVKRLTEWKIPNIEVFFNTQSELKEDYISRIMEMCDKAGTKVVSIHPFTSFAESLAFFSNYEGNRFEDSLEYYRMYFRAAKQMGAKLLVFHGDSPKNMYFAAEQAYERIRTLDRLGWEEYGIRTAHENVSWCKGRNPEYFVKLKEFYPEMTFVLDIKQAIRSERNPAEYIEKLGNSITHIHLSDNNVSLGKDCLPVGEGNMDIKGFLKLLKDSQFSGCVLEELYRTSFDSPEALRRSYEKLNEIIAGL